VASCSQKALMCPPGLGLVSLSVKAREVVCREDRLPRFYFDFRKALNSVEKSETPFTTPVALMAGLCEAVEMIHEEGLGNVLERHRRLSTALRAGCEALGLRSFPQADRVSSTVVCLHVPESLKGSEIVRGMYERHRSVIAGSRNKLDGKVIRIGTMGDLDAGDIFTDLLHLEDTLRTLGWQAAPECGVAAAAKEILHAR
jgi:aspartate aminotransferase-like enzyme